MSSFPDPQREARLRAALMAAIRHAMEATCGYCPADAELEDAVRAGLVCLADSPEQTPPAA